MMRANTLVMQDIKASNILVDNHGVCKITDFGLSKPSGQEEAYDPNSNTLMKGTVFWMAPEVVQNSKYSAKIDIWSLGCTVIEMLTGDHPWMEMNMLAALYSVSVCFLCLQEAPSHWCISFFFVAWQVQVTTDT